MSKLPIALLLPLLGCGETPPAPGAALAGAAPETRWRLERALVADLDGDGAPDYVALGERDSTVQVGIVRGGAPGAEPVVLGFPPGRLCSRQVEIRLEEVVAREAGSDAGGLLGSAGTTAPSGLPPGTRGVELLHGDCDPFYLFWSAAHGRFTYWRL